MSNHHEILTLSDAEKKRPSLALSYRVHCLGEIKILRGPRQDDYLAAYNNRKLENFIRKMQPGEPEKEIVAHFWDELLKQDVTHFERPADDWQPPDTIDEPLRRFRIQAFLYQRHINAGPAGLPVDESKLRELYISEVKPPGSITW